MLDKEQVLQMYKDGLSYATIALKLGSSADTVGQCLRRNFPQAIEKRKSSKGLGYNAKTKRDEVVFIKSFGNSPYDCNMSDFSFFKANRGAYKSDKKGGFYFDEERNSLRTQDVPEKIMFDF